MKNRIIFFLIFLLSVTNIYSLVPGYVNLHGGFGVGTDNFEKDLFFYERLRYSLFAGTGFNIDKHIAIGGEYAFEMRFLNSYTSYGKEFATTVKDTKHNNWKPTNDLQDFELYDMSHSFRAYLNYFFLPETKFLSLNFFLGFRIGSLSFKGFYNDPNFTRRKKAEGDGLIIGMDLGTRLTLGIFYIEYSFAPIFIGFSPLLLRQMNKVSIGLIVQLEMDPLTYAILSVIKAASRSHTTVVYY